MELSYLELLESLSGSPVKGRATSVKEHNKTLSAMGYASDYYVTANGNTPTFDTYEKYMEYICKNLSEDRPVVVATNLGSGHFVTIIGVDDMGTDYIYDDVIVTADSCDYWDGYQDGYSLYSAYKFFTQFTNGSYSKLQQHIVIYDNKE